ncbi:MAG: DUF3431 domain-containing protein [Kiritimatiellae bacterium]|nr:DUF3431 domain-containing protein [Kiritimatiellia bacterium]
MSDARQPPRVELVVARFQEDVKWLRRVPRAIRVHVYDKSGRPDSAYSVLPNVGREAHTYLHHLVTHYEELPDILVFTQGHPFDHAPDMHKRLRAIAEGKERISDFRWFGFLVDCDDALGARLFQRWSKNPDARPLPMDSFWRDLFDREEMPETFTFFGGAQFAVARECVHWRPRAFYERALNLAASLPDAAHCFERTWDRVFGVNGIPLALRNQPLPIFLKPIRGRPPAGAS